MAITPKPEKNYSMYITAPIIMAAITTFINNNNNVFILYLFLKFMIDLHPSP